jgi:succinoglycan biosynthesis protein ExoA
MQTADGTLFARAKSSSVTQAKALSPWHDMSHITCVPSDCETPFVSVVIPIRNEARFIGRCLEAVVDQDYPAGRMEIIVADGLSTDETREIVDSFSTRHPGLRVITNAGKIVTTGLNAAIAAASGDIIVRVDGHCEIAKDYVSQCVRHLQTGVDAVGGPLDTIGETVVAQAIAVGMSSTFGVGNSAFRTSKGQTRLVDTVAFPAYPRAVLDRLGPFDEELVRNQDDEYNYRLRKHGGRILLAADVRANYFSRSSLRSLWRQYSQYGFWKVRVLQKHPRQMSARQFVPALFVTGLLGCTLGSILRLVPWSVVAAVAGSYLLVNLAASVHAARANRRIAMVLPLVFAILHFSYGFGFLRGLIAFRRRWRDRRSSISIPADPIVVRTR